MNSKVLKFKLFDDSKNTYRLFEISYRFKTLHDDTCNTEEQNLKRNNSITIVRLSVIEP